MISVTAGLAAAAVFGLSWIFAAMADPEWTFGSDMLSDLGVSNASASMFFNMGCVAGGVMLAICGAGIALTGARSYRVSGTAIGLAGISLIFVGVFPSDTGRVHEFFAIGLFIFGMIAMAAMTAGDWLRRRVFFACAGAVMILFIFATFAKGPLAYSEGMAVAVLLLWLSMNCVKIFTKAEFS